MAEHITPTTLEQWKEKYPLNPGDAITKGVIYDLIRLLQAGSSNTGGTLFPTSISEIQGGANDEKYANSSLLHDWAIRFLKRIWEPVRGDDGDPSLGVGAYLSDGTTRTGIPELRFLAEKTAAWRQFLYQINKTAGKAIIKGNIIPELKSSDPEAGNLTLGDNENMFHAVFAATAQFGTTISNIVNSQEINTSSINTSKYYFGTGKLETDLILDADGFILPARIKGASIDPNHLQYESINSAYLNLDAGLVRLAGSEHQNAATGLTPFNSALGVTIANGGTKRIDYKIYKETTTDQGAVEPIGVSANVPPPDSFIAIYKDRNGLYIKLKILSPTYDFTYSSAGIPKVDTKYEKLPSIEVLEVFDSQGIVGKDTYSILGRYDSTITARNEGRPITTIVPGSPTRQYQTTTGVATITENLYIIVKSHVAFEPYRKGANQDDLLKYPKIDISASLSIDFDTRTSASLTWSSVSKNTAIFKKEGPDVADFEAEIQTKDAIEAIGDSSIKIEKTKQTAVYCNIIGEKGYTVYSSGHVNSTSSLFGPGYSGGTLTVDFGTPTDRDLIGKVLGLTSERTRSSIAFKGNTKVSSNGFQIRGGNGEIIRFLPVYTKQAVLNGVRGAVNEANLSSDQARTAFQGELLTFYSEEIVDKYGVPAILNSIGSAGDKNVEITHLIKDIDTSNSVSFSEAIDFAIPLRPLVSSKTINYDNSKITNDNFNRLERDKQKLYIYFSFPQIQEGQENYQTSNYYPYSSFRIQVMIHLQDRIDNKIANYSSYRSGLILTDFIYYVKATSRTPQTLNTLENAHIIQSHPFFIELVSLRDDRGVIQTEERYISDPTISIFNLISQSSIRGNNKSDSPRSNKGNLPIYNGGDERYCVLQLSLSDDRPIIGDTPSSRVRYIDSLPITIDTIFTPLTNTTRLYDVGLSFPQLSQSSGHTPGPNVKSYFSFL